MGALIDSCGRRLEYLRVSVTDRCNLRCLYCLPAAGLRFKPADRLMTPAELERLARVGLRLGIDKVRLTGGEPLVRAEILEIVDRLAGLGLADLSLTTNGLRLAKLAEPLSRAGLRRVNVSLDSLRPERFRAITRLGELERVREGLAAAFEAGLEPVKLNVVVARGMNDDELADFAALTLRSPLHVRFIELMPIGETGFFRPDRRVGLEEIRRAVGALEPAQAPRGFGPAETFRLHDACGTVGFISALSARFCDSCNRMRLSSDGRLLPCLAAPEGIDLLGPLRSGATDGELEALFRRAATIKPERHRMEEGAAREYSMCSVGG